MTTPTWLAATPNSPAPAGQINQFLVSHKTRWLYEGNMLDGDLTLGASTVPSNGQWIAQQIAAPPAAADVGRVALFLAVTGAPPPMTVQLRQTLTGPALAATVVPAEFLTTSAILLSLPMPATVAAGASYFVVTAAAGDAANFYSWTESTAVTGASTSPDGQTWTGQSFGLIYEVFDQSGGGPLRNTYEDDGARWAGLDYLGDLVATIREYTVGQASGYAASVRQLSYSGNAITGAS